jgi:hypothetical protein
MDYNYNKVHPQQLIMKLWPNTKLWMDVLLEVNYLMNNIIIGEVIPIRLFLSGYDMTPTLKKIANKFHVK